MKKIKYYTNKSHTSRRNDTSEHHEYREYNDIDVAISIIEYKFGRGGR